jgi:hypothetical protein
MHTTIINYNYDRHHDFVAISMVVCGAWNASYLLNVQTGSTANRINGRAAHPPFDTWILTFDIYQDVPMVVIPLTC